MIMRKAKEEDKNELAKLYVKFWKAHAKCDPLIELKYAPNERNQARLVEKDLERKNTYLFVAEDDCSKKKKIAGFAEFLVITNEPYFKVRQYVYIDSCFINKKYRGDGLIRDLVDFGIEFLKEEKKIQQIPHYVKLNTYVFNKGAMRVWKRDGFDFKAVSMIKKV